MASSMNFEEMQEAEEQAKPPVEASPAEKEAQARIERLEASLRLSEESRIRAIAEGAARGAVPAPVPESKAPEGPKDLTAEELQNLMQEDPTKALMLGMEQTRRKVTQEVEQRMAPMVNSGYDAQASMAKQKFASDFDVIGPEIDAFIKTMPIAQRNAALGNQEGWETMVNYLRGQHIDKIVSARITKEIDQRMNSARGDQISSAPVPIDSGVRTPPPQSSGGIVFDSTTIEIMKNILNTDDTPKARAEWVKWSNKSAGV